jgi:hypothetical protein
VAVIAPDGLPYLIFRGVIECGKKKYALKKVRKRPGYSSVLKSIRIPRIVEKI